MSKKKILVIHATTRDKIELSKPSFNDQYEFYFQDYDDSRLEKILCHRFQDNIPVKAPNEEINQLINFAKTHKIEGIISTEDYPGCLYASVVAKELNLSAPSTQSLLSCSHKFLSRIFQQQFVPHATPAFFLIDCAQNVSPALAFPFFVKPIKSYFSINANKVDNEASLNEVLQQSIPPKEFLHEFHWFLANHSTFELNADYLMGEALLQGQQVTLEGTIFNGNIEVLGIVDSIMFPDTICFERFDYPSSLSDNVQQRMAEIAKQFIAGIQFNNGLFNIELIYNAQNDSIHIIEVNPRMSSQFADLYEKVDGFNPYQLLVDIALNIPPTHRKREGDFNVASSFVLRVFNDFYVNNIPKTHDLAQLKKIYPDAHIEIYATKNATLSSFLQDGKSYRYGIINIGASDLTALKEKFNHCKTLLPFEFCRL